MTDIPKFAAHHRASDDDWQTLEGHLHGVARWARRFSAKLGLPAHGELIGLLHDLGKYSQAFQAYLKSATGHLEQDIDDECVSASTSTCFARRYRQAWIETAPSRRRGCTPPVSSAGIGRRG